MTTMHLLVPIDATPRSRWGIQYAVWQHRTGKKVDVSLLYVVEPLMRRFDTLRFRTEQEIAAFRFERAKWLLDDAALPLRENKISHVAYIREGNVVFEILDTAEQLDCSEIVLPSPPHGWLRCLARNIVLRVLRKQRTVPVVTVNQHGLPGKLERDISPDR
jgi:nucleotide-binding universal stress UspA family protein